MTVNITSILKEAASRSAKRNGLVLVGIVFGLSLLGGLLGAGVAQSVDQQFAAVEMGTNAWFVLPPLVAGLLSLLVGVASLVVSIAAIRVFVSDETERLPREHFTRNMGWAAVNFVVGAVVFGIAVVLGLAALIIPGVFLLVTLAFWGVFVAVEDQNFIEGFRSSWGLTRGHRLKLLLLGIAVMVVSILVEVVFDVGGAISGTVGAFVLAQATSALVTVFSSAALAITYTELTALREEEGRFSVEEEPAPPGEGVESV